MMKPDDLGQGRNLAEILAEKDAAVSRLNAQLEDAEIALNTWDRDHNSEYWLRYPRNDT